jgi:long-subunit fatty acid transport protein
MKDSNSFRLGGEYRLNVGPVGLIGRLGVAYETSSLPPAYETPLTVDANKVVASAGLGLAIFGKLRLDVMASHAFQSDVNVPSGSAAVPLINPVQGNPTATDTVNGGIYHVNLWVWGAGLEYKL